jgi:hypothetical protein
MLTSRQHPVTGHHTGDRTVRPPRADRPKSWWTRFKLVRACARTLGHCWHLEDHSWTDWYCCGCPALVEGLPPNNCCTCNPVPAL